MIEFLNAISMPWWSWASALALQVAVLGLLVYAIDLPLKRRGWPQVRYALWAVLFVKLLLPPSFALPTGLASHLLKPEAPVVAAHATLVREVVTMDTNRAPMPQTVATYTPRAPLAAPAARLSLESLAMLLWAGVVLALCVWLVVRLRGLRRIARRAEADWAAESARSAAARLGMKRIPRVVATDKVKSAAVFGVLRPVVAIPSGWREGYTDRQMEHILLHEFAHVRRGDLSVNAVQTLLHIVFWFHPVVWFAGRRVRQLRELCCDATVARVLGVETEEYRETLIEAGRRIVESRLTAGLGLLGLFESRASFMNRLEHLAGPLWKYRRLRIAAAAAALLAMGLFIVPMGRLKAAQPTATGVSESTDTHSDGFLTRVYDVHDLARDSAAGNELASRIMAEVDKGVWNNPPEGYVASYYAGGRLIVYVPKATNDRVRDYIDDLRKAAVAALPSEKVQLAGVLLDVDGRPAAGVKISAYSEAYPDAEGVSSLTAITTGDGRFSLEVVRLPLAQWDLVAAPEGKIAFGKTTLPREGAAEPITMRLDAADGKVSGTLVDEIGQPVSSALLWVVEIHRVASETGSSPYYRVHAEQKALRAQTGPDGTFEIVGLPRGNAVELFCYAKGYTRSSASGPGEYQIHNVKTDGGRRTIEITHPGSIRGSVVCSDPRVPLGGITIQPQHYASSEPFVDSASSGKTAYDGSFLIEGVPAGDYTLVAVEPEKAAWRYVPWSRVTVEPGKEVRTTVAISTGVNVSGRVVDRATHKPLPPGKVGFTISLQSSDGLSYSSVSTRIDVGEGGVFETRVAPGIWTVGAYTMDDKGKSTDDPASMRKIEVKAGEDMVLPDIEVAMPEQAKAPKAQPVSSPMAVELTVLNEDGTPASGAEVTAYPGPIPTRVEQVKATTGADGRVTMDLAAAECWGIVARRGSLIALGDVTSVPHDKRRSYTSVPGPMRLTEADGEVAGKVADEKGKPLRGATVWVSELVETDPAKPGQPVRMSDPRMLKPVSPASPSILAADRNWMGPCLCEPLKKAWTVETGRDGAFRIKGLPRSYTANLIIDLKGRASAEDAVVPGSGPVNVTLAPEARVAVKITAEPALSGELKKLLAGPFPEESLVWLTQVGTSSETRRWSGNPDKNGTVTFDALPAGQYDAFLNTDNAADYMWVIPHGVKVAAGGTGEMTIELIRGSLVRGRVVDRATGKLLHQQPAGPMFSIGFKREGEEHVLTNCTSGEGFARRVPPDTYTVNLYTSDNRPEPAPSTANLPDGTTKHVVAGSKSVSVPFGGAAKSITAVNGQDIDLGDLLIDIDASGRPVVATQAVEDAVLPDIEVAVPGNGKAPKDQPASNPAAVELTVLNEDGTPAAGAEVTAYPGPVGTKVTQVQATSGADGRVKMDLAATGSWAIVARRGSRLALGDVMRFATPSCTFVPGPMRLAEADAEARGSVVDEKGRPLRDVTVWVSELVEMDPARPGQAAGVFGIRTVTPVSPDNPSVLAADHNEMIPCICPPLKKAWTVETGRDGTFVIRGLPRTYTAKLVFERKGRANVDRSFVPGSGPVSVVLAPEAVIVGKVTAEPALAGELKRLLSGPLPELGIVWLAGDGAPGERIEWSRNPDKDGAFTFEAMPAGKYELYLRASYGDRHTCAQGAQVTLTAGRTSNIELKLVRGAIVKGRIVDKATREPIAPGTGGFVASTQPINGDTQLYGGIAFKLGDAGTFEVALAPGEWNVGGFVISGGGRQVPDSGSLRRIAAKAIEDVTLPDIEVTVPAKEMALKEQPVWRPAAVEFTVLNEDGTPAAGAEVTAYPGPVGTKEAQVKATAGADGLVKMELSAAERWALVARQGSRLALAEVDHDAKHSHTFVPAAMRLTDADAEVRGKVLDEKGKPLKGVTVWVSRLVEKDPAKPGQPSTMSDPITATPAQSADVSILSADRNEMLPCLCAPLIWAWTAKTGRDGAFTIKGLPRTYTPELTFVGEGRAWIDPVVAGSEPVTVTLVRGARITGKITAEPARTAELKRLLAGPLPEGGVVWLTRTGAQGKREKWSLNPDKEGTFSFEGLPAGEYVLNFELKGDVDYACTDSFKLTPQSTCKVEIKLNAKQAK